MKKPAITAQALGLNPASRQERDLFAWLLASFLCGKRIQQEVALSAYRVIVEKNGIDSVSKMKGQSHRQWVAMLGEGRYVRYDESTATRLTAMACALEQTYDGQVARLLELSADRQEAEQRLQAFDGIGPKTAEIFLREAWPL